MNTPSELNAVAWDIAQTLIKGFNKHYFCFIMLAQRQGILRPRRLAYAMQRAITERIQFYTERVMETVEQLQCRFHADALDDSTWQQVKLYFIGMLMNHKQPELAETFFNSVFCRILDRDYFNSDFIFTRPVISTGIYRVRPADLPQLLPRPQGFCARRWNRLWPILAGTVPLPTSDATSSR